ncbi:hypothetical protein D4Q52_10555 [Rhodopseudomonas palustris]|uniref:Uncharacterized protein n=2 Tax=Rhodopseudomonas palustris TaxID=1076 RepID=A0A418VG53_RHOPL|nr:hypothetical protein D4Q52_10555 [Rhodopseudomonas palustris]
MLPGIRFLFAAVALAVSMLVFGLGAAALLRASHEQFANVMTVRPAPVLLAARPAEPPMPTLSMLRVEPTNDPQAPAAVSTAPAAESATPAQDPISLNAQPAVRHDESTPPAQTSEAVPNAAAPEPVATAPSAAPAVADKPSQQSSATLPTAAAVELPSAEPTKSDRAAPDTATEPAPAGATVPSAAPSANATPAQTAATSEPRKPDDTPAEAAKLAPVAQNEQSDQPAAGATAVPAGTEAAKSESGEALPEVAALTGPIPTPRRDPRGPAKPATSSSDQPSSSETALEQAVQPDAPETTSSITSPKQKAETPSATRPKAAKRPQAKRKVKRRRQSEVRRPAPVFARPAMAPMSPFGFPPT